MWEGEQTNRERESRGGREEAEETDEHLYKLNGFQDYARLSHSWRTSAHPAPDWMAQAQAYLYSLFAMLALGHFDDGVKVGVSLAFANVQRPCKWDTSGFSVKHLTLAFYGHSSTRRGWKCSGRERGNNCSCKPWQVANKAVRDSASPVFTFAPQFVIIEKHSPKSVAYFSVPQTIYLIYAFCFANLNWHRVGNTTKVLSTSRELATGRGRGNYTGKCENS